MTISRRLFLSNILMILIPVVFSILISYGILFLFTQNSPVPMEQAFPHAFEAVSRFQRSKDLEELRGTAAEFNRTFGGGVYMAVMEGNDFLVPESPGDFFDREDRLLYMLLTEGATGTITINGRRFVIEEVEDYRIILLDTDAGRHGFRPPVKRVSTILVIALILILLTNRLLTGRLSKSITVPLKQLAHGARQLGEGNLDYRIAYSGKDEFAPVCADFNEMADHLQSLIQYQQKNEQSRKELIAGISHDLRTPLTSIRAYVEGLLDGVADDLSAQLKYLGIIRNKAEDIDRLVDKLFLFSKLDIGDYPVKPERLDIGEELRGMAQMADDEYAEKGLHMTLQDDVHSVFIRADPVYLRNIFVNILENSIRYKTKQRCSVNVECRVEKLRVTVCITDDGPGVEESELAKLFDVFYRGDPSRQNPSKGSGLGLAICARMMDKIGGGIRARLPEQGGLCMELQFPRDWGNAPTTQTEVEQ